MCGVIFKFVELSTRRKTNYRGGREDGYQLDDNSFHPFQVDLSLTN